MGKKRPQNEQAQLEDDEERHLTAMIFGGSFNSDDVNTLHKELNEGADIEKSEKKSKKRSKQNKEYVNVDTQQISEDFNQGILTDEPLFMIDREARDVDGFNDEEDKFTSQDVDILEEESQERNVDSDDSNDEENSQEAAWKDEDDHDTNKNSISFLSSKHKNNNYQSLRKSKAETEIKYSEYVNRQRSYFENVTTARTDWAKVQPSSTTNHLNDQQNLTPTVQSLLSSSDPLLAEGSNAKGSLISKKSSSSILPLPPSQINIVRCKDVNWREKHTSTIRSVQFHPIKDQNNGKELMFTASLDKRLQFFKINSTGERNEKVQSIFFPDMPIYKASFLGNTGNVIASGRRSFFYTYHAEAGKIEKIPRIHGRAEKSLESFITSPNGEMIVFFGNDGYLLLWEVKSKRLVGTLKINGQVRCASFTEDSNELLASGTDGDIYRFDVRSRRCISRFQNEDGTISSSLSLSSQFMAIGAESGVVNLYPANNKNSTATSALPPIKSILNIKTLVSNVAFNKTGEILAMSSKMDKNAFRLFHVPTKSVFSNWPTTKTPLGYIFSMDFSSDSKFLALGNDKGKCLLYKLNHYT